MTSTLSGLDVDLADGNFYADRNAREAYKWMRANQPVFRDRNGLAAATTSQALPQEQVVPCYPPHLRRHSRNLLLVDLRLCVVVGIVNIPGIVRLMYTKS